MSDNIEAVTEVIAALVKSGMDINNPPIGFVGGEDYHVLKGMPLRLTKTTFMAQIVNGEIIDFNKNLPFGFLHVESPEVKPKTIIALRHKLDFSNAWLLEERGALKDEEFEVHVRYKPAKGLKGLFGVIFPMFEYLILREGSLEDIYRHKTNPNFEEDVPLIRLYGLEQENNSRFY